MPSLSAVSMEQLFAPEANLNPYEEMGERDLYFSLMRGAFQHQGKPAEDSNLTMPFLGTYGGVRDNPNGETETDDTVTLEDGQEVRVETSVVDYAYAGVDWPWGPLAHISLSAVDGSRIIRFGATAKQEHQELFLSAGASLTNALTGKVERKQALVPHKWVGNVEGGKASDDAKRVFKPSVFRELTPREKRLFGVALEGLGQLAPTPA